MAYSEIRDLVQELGTLSAQRKVIEEQMDKKKKELKALVRTHGGEFLEAKECTRCGGSGKDDDGTCISCNGCGERYIFVCPKEDDDVFQCSIYEVSRREVNYAKAKELLKKNTYLAIFQPQGHGKVDVRPTAKGRASLGN